MTNKKRFISIRKKFIIVLLIVVMFIANSISYSVYRKTNTLIHDSYSKEVDNKIDILSGQVYALQESTERLARTVTATGVMKLKMNKSADKELYAMFEKLHKNFPEVINIIYDYGNKFYIFPRNEELEDQYSEPAEFQATLDETPDTSWTAPYVDAATGSWTMTYQEKLYDGNKAYGLVQIDLSLAHIQDLINTIQVGKSGKLYITDNEGMILISPFDNLVNEDILDKKLYNMVNQEERGSLLYFSTKESSRSLRKWIMNLVGNT